VPMDRRVTHEPSPVRYATRLFWELLRLTLPGLPLLLVALWICLVRAAEARMGPATHLAVADYTRQSDTLTLTWTPSPDV